MKIVKPKVSVIIVNWNGRHLLQDCLSSLAKQTFKDFEIILVDNGSKDGSVEYVESRFPDTRIIALNKNLGFSGGNNIGFEASSSDYVALLNNDTEVEPDWLEKLYLHLKDSQQVAACDSKVLYYDHRDLIWSAGGEYSIAGSVCARGDIKDTNQFQNPEEVFIAVACAALYRRDVLNEIGLFDEDFFTGYEDVDFSFRAHLRGYRTINVPTARVYHKVSATQVRNSPSFVFHGQRNVASVFIKNMPTELLFRYLPYHILYTTGSLAYFMRIKRGGAFLKAKLNVIKQLPSLLEKRKQVQSLRTVSAGEIDLMLNRNWLRSKAKKLLK